VPDFTFGVLLLFASVRNLMKDLPRDLGGDLQSPRKDFFVGEEKASFPVPLDNPVFGVGLTFLPPCAMGISLILFLEKIELGTYDEVPENDSRPYDEWFFFGVFVGDIGLRLFKAFSGLGARARGGNSTFEASKFCEFSNRSLAIWMGLSRFRLPSKVCEYSYRSFSLSRSLFFFASIYP